MFYPLINPEKLPEYIIDLGQESDSIDPKGLMLMFCSEILYMQISEAGMALDLGTIASENLYEETMGKLTVRYQYELEKSNKMIVERMVATFYYDYLQHKQGVAHYLELSPNDRIFYYTFFSDLEKSTLLVSQIFKDQDVLLFLAIALDEQYPAFIQSFNNKYKTTLTEQLHLDNRVMVGTSAIKKKLKQYVKSGVKYFRALYHWTQIYCLEYFGYHVRKGTPSILRKLGSANRIVKVLNAWFTVLSANYGYIKDENIISLPNIIK